METIGGDFVTNTPLSPHCILLRRYLSHELYNLLSVVHELCSTTSSLHVHLVTFPVMTSTPVLTDTHVYERMYQMVTK